VSGPTVAQRLAAETPGTSLLLATVIGSGIMAERLSGGNVALALLGNTLPTGAVLFVSGQSPRRLPGPDRAPCRVSAKRLVFQ
jgi:hypothetical protein